MMKKLFRAFGILSVLVLPTLVLAQTTGNAGFVPLTNIPSLQFVGNETQLPEFLNSVYKICIGLAAVLGVLQIMRAGLTWMTAGGSHEKIGEARGLIRDAILGLLLVLAPTIVFSIINPDILSLRIGNLNQLALPNGAGGAAATADRILWSDSNSTYASAITRCAQQGGYVVPNCTPTGSTTATPIPDGGTCNGTLTNICMTPSGTAQTLPTTCSAYASIKSQTAGSICDGGQGYTKIAASCCSGGSVCCGSQTPTYSPANPPPSVIPNTADTTREPNPSCTTRYPSGTTIPWDNNQAAQCCEYQEGATVTCTLTRSVDSQTQQCTCTAK
jgi:hypothetical protein